MSVMPETAIRPFHDSKPLLPGTPGIERKAGSQAAGSDAELHREKAWHGCKNGNRVRSVSGEVENERILGAKRGDLYAFWHRCHGYAFGRFESERTARVWGRVYGWQFDGQING